MGSPADRLRWARESLRLHCPHASGDVFTAGLLGDNTIPLHRLFLVPPGSPADGGRVVDVAARRNLALTPATVLLLPAARRYRFEFAPGLRLMGFHFQLEAVPGRDVLGGSVRLQRRAGDARRLAAAWKAFAADDAGAWFAVEAVLRQHLAELVRLPWAAVDAALLMQRRWSGVLEDLERLGARRAVAACAHRQGLSREGFSRRFRRDLGLSPSAWLAQRLADRARARLRGSDAPLAAIAVELGFSDGFALSRFLKRVTGLRPSAIRAAPPGP